VRRFASGGPSVIFADLGSDLYATPLSVGNQWRPRLDTSVHRRFVRSESAAFQFSPSPAASRDRAGISVALEKRFPRLFPNLFHCFDDGRPFPIFVTKFPRGFLFIAVQPFKLLLHIPHESCRSEKQLPDYLAFPLRQIGPSRLSLRSLAGIAFGFVWHHGQHGQESPVILPAGE
jgi:hypothetical protein